MTCTQNMKSSEAADGPAGIVLHCGARARESVAFHCGMTHDSCVQCTGGLVRRHRGRRCRWWCLAGSRCCVCAVLKLVPHLEATACAALCGDTYGPAGGQVIRASTLHTISCGAALQLSWKCESWQHAVTTCAVQRLHTTLFPALSSLLACTVEIAA
jgi:hypothetical protein